MQSQLVNKKQRIVQGQGVFNINYRTVGFNFGQFAGFYNHSPGGIHFEYAFYSLRSPAEPRENDLAHSLLAERMGNPKSAPPPPNPHAKKKKNSNSWLLEYTKTTDSCV